MIRQVLIFALLALTHVLAKDMKCPSMTGKLPFDESKFAGTWYPVAMYHPEEVKASDKGEKSCVTMNVSTLRTDTAVTMKMEGTGKINGKEKTFEGYSQAIKIDKPSTFYGSFKKNDESKFSGVYKQSVIATDYDTYAIFMACGTEFEETDKTFSRKLYINIMSRQKTLSEETLKVLKNIISSYDIDMDKVKKVEHNDC